MTFQHRTDKGGLIVFGELLQGSRVCMTAGENVGIRHRFKRLGSKFHLQRMPFFIFKIEDDLVCIQLPFRHAAYAPAFMKAVSAGLQGGHAGAKDALELAVGDEFGNLRMNSGHREVENAEKGALPRLG